MVALGREVEAAHEAGVGKPRGESGLLLSDARLGVLEPDEGADLPEQERNLLAEVGAKGVVERRKPSVQPAAWATLPPRSPWRKRIPAGRPPPAARACSMHDR